MLRLIFPNAVAKLTLKVEQTFPCTIFFHVQSLNEVKRTTVIKKLSLLSLLSLTPRKEHEPRIS